MKCMQYLFNQHGTGHVQFFRVIKLSSMSTALTTILLILFLYLNTVTVTAGTFEP